MKHYLCSHLVMLHWNSRKASANLERIWTHGATINAEECIEPGTELLISLPEYDLTTRVIGCSAEAAGHFIEVEFQEGYEWTPQRFEPRHLTDPDVVRVHRMLSEMSQK